MLSVDTEAALLVVGNVPLVLLIIPGVITIRSPFSIAPSSVSVNLDCELAATNPPSGEFCTAAGLGGVYRSIIVLLITPDFDTGQYR